MRDSRVPEFRLQYFYDFPLVKGLLGVGVPGVLAATTLLVARRAGWPAEIRQVMLLVCLFVVPLGLFYLYIRKRTPTVLEVRREGILYRLGNEDQLLPVSDIDQVVRLRGRDPRSREPGSVGSVVEARGLQFSSPNVAEFRTWVEEVVLPAREPIVMALPSELHGVGRRERRFAIVVVVYAAIVLGCLALEVLSIGV